MAAKRPGVVLATGNPHKLREISAMLANEPFDLLGLMGFPEVMLPAETGTTFEENAVEKAVAAARGTGLVALGDDSGLEVDALAGAPGVRSARYAGEHATDRDNLELLLQNLAEVPDDRRSARFVCVIAVAHPDGRVKVVRGACEGEIIRQPRGSHGFGYDPIFLIAADGRTLAQFSPDEKNAISHRARAIHLAAPTIRLLLQAQSGIRAPMARVG
jgi:XTP/dITP diphosphohydrolase